VVRRGAEAACNTFAVTRAFVGVVLRAQSGCKELPSRERPIADIRVLAPVGAVSLGGGLALRVLTPRHSGVAAVSAA
jgi:hypothetical protein